MKRSIIISAIIFLLGISTCTRSWAEEAISANLYSGDFRGRSTLTVDWGGGRNDLAGKGVTIDMSLTQIFQGVVDGGKDSSWEYSGRGNMTIKADTQKMGLWPGGFFALEIEGNYEDPVNLNSGSLMPVDSSHLYPTPGGDNLNVPEVSFAQFFSEYAGVILGKLDTTSGDGNEFAHGKGDKQFYNLAFNINPALFQAGQNLANITDRFTVAGKVKRSMARTSIDSMAPTNPTLLAVAELPFPPNVKAHSIIAIKGNDQPPEGDDGVVAYTSAHMEGVESELVVHYSHSCQDKPPAIEEVRRILLEHLRGR